MNLDTVVQKYGGSSVANIEKIRNVAKRLISQKNNGKKVVGVVSAMGKTTNDLLEMARLVSKNPNSREIDMLLSTGEQVTISLLSMMIDELGYKAISFTGLQIPFITEGFHNKSKIKNVDTTKIKKCLDDDYIVIVAGFQGVNDLGDITTLGRGGSDTSAVALACKLDCPCEIYTDVNGIYSLDPRLYPSANKLDYVSYEEMMEMANLGAKVMEPRSVELASRYGIPIYVGSSTSYVDGTIIKEYGEKMERSNVTGLSVTDNIMEVKLDNIPNSNANISKIFSKLAEKNVNIDMISENSYGDGFFCISFTAESSDEYVVDSVMMELKKDVLDMKYSKNIDVVKVSVIGNSMRTQSGIAASIFQIFSDNNINFSQVTTSEISISYTIPSLDKDKTVNLLAKKLNL